MFCSIINVFNLTFNAPLLNKCFNSLNKTFWTGVHYIIVDIWPVRDYYLFFELLLKARNGLVFRVIVYLWVCPPGKLLSWWSGPYQSAWACPVVSPSLGTPASVLSSFHIDALAAGNKWLQLSIRQMAGVKGRSLITSIIHKCSINHSLLFSD